MAGYCARCGSRIPEGAAACPVCGMAVLSDREALVRELEETARIASRTADICREAAEEEKRGRKSCAVLGVAFSLPVTALLMAVLSSLIAMLAPAAEDPALTGAAEFLTDRAASALGGVPALGVIADQPYYLLLVAAALLAVCVFAHGTAAGAMVQSSQVRVRQIRREAERLLRTSDVPSDDYPWEYFGPTASAWLLSAVKSGKASGLPAAVSALGKYLRTADSDPSAAAAAAGVAADRELISRLFPE